MSGWGWKKLDFEDRFSPIRYDMGFPLIKYSRALKSGERYLARFKMVFREDTIAILFKGEIIVRTWEETGTCRLGAEIETDPSTKTFILEAFEKDKELKYILGVWKRYYSKGLEKT